MDRATVVPDVEPALSRRNVLKRGAVVGGALVWTAPLVQTLGVSVADAASGGSTPTDPPDGCLASASGAGTVLSLLGAPLPGVSSGNSAASVEGQRSASGSGELLSISTELVAAETLRSFVSCSVTDTRAYTATTSSVQTVRLNVPGVLTLSARVLSAVATAEASATTIRVSAASQVADLVVNGQSIAVTAPNFVVSPGPLVTVTVDRRRWTTTPIPKPGDRVGTAEAIGLEVVVLPIPLVLPDGLTLTVARSTATASWPC